MVVPFSFRMRSFLRLSPSISTPTEYTFTYVRPLLCNLTTSLALSIASDNKTITHCPCEYNQQIHSFITVCYFCSCSVPLFLVYLSSSDFAIIFLLERHQQQNLTHSTFATQRRPNSCCPHFPAQSEIFS